MDVVAAAMLAAMLLVTGRAVMTEDQAGSVPAQMESQAEPEQPAPAPEAKQPTKRQGRR